MSDGLSSPGLHPSLRPLISASDLQQRVRELGALISQNYGTSELHLVCVLKGSFMFMADLVRAITIPCQMHFVRASSYGSGSSSSGVVDFFSDLQLAEKHVLIIEDILETGFTLQRILTWFETQRPASLEVCVLLSKKVARAIQVNVRYVGFHIPDEFVVGYGLDLSEHYRELPYIAQVISPSGKSLS